MIKKKAKLIKAPAARKAIKFARLSSGLQDKGNSLEAQDDALNKYCERLKFDVIGSFKIIESSSRGDRKKFMEIIKFISEQKEPIALVIDKVDRLQRRQTETPILDALIKQGKLELHFVSESYIINQSSGAYQLYMWGMGIANAKLYTDLLSERVTRSLKHKVEVNGEWYELAPLGYLNTRDQRGKGIIVPDPVTAPLIKKLFDEYATGTYTLRQIVNQAEKWGLYVKTGQPVSKSVIDRLFTTVKCFLTAKYFRIVTNH